jgi:SAM-dependent methyltransferase
MHTSNRVPESLVSRPGLLQAARRACLVKTWDLSGLLVTRYYERLLRQHGRSPQALAERGQDKDLEFYQHLFHGVDLPARLSVLDIGCGMGDMIDFLQLRDTEIESYLGIDLVEPFIDLCRHEYLPPCRFQRASFTSRSFAPAERFDLVVSMGVLVSRVFQYDEYVEYSIEKMLGLSTRYVLFNLITEVDRSLGNYKHSHRIGHITSLPKKRLVEILARVTRRVRADYAIHEVRIYPDATDAFVRITLPS